MRLMPAETDNSPGRQDFKVTTSPPSDNELNDAYEVFTPTQEEIQRQQSRFRDTQTQDRLTATQSPVSVRTLRRTPNLSQSTSSQPASPPRRTHIEAASVGIRTPAPTQDQKQPQAYFASHDISSGSSLVPPPIAAAFPPADTALPQSRLRISKHTASAILYTLEEALRQPNQFTPDLLEEQASMSDLRGASDVRGVAGNGHGNGNGASSRAPQPTGSPAIKGPRDIMRERAAREARKKAEQEALEIERARAEEEARQLEDMRRRAEAKNTGTAGVGPRTSGGEAGYRSSGSANPAQRISDNSRRSDRTNEGRVQDVSLSGRGTGGAALGGGEAVSAPGVRVRQPTSSQVRASRGAAGEVQANLPQGEGIAGGEPSSRRATNTSSFPHAFERWETLSAHWEGLTSFWIRRLESNAEDIAANPLSQQLARQVTDLSAAGANLFHAVVELQRLRASSERKFQRWFFETRQEQERSREMAAAVEQQLLAEREERTKALEELAKRAESSSADHKVVEMQKQLAEMRRELQISKEEARRAWEELGRREQDERERTMSLREGLPTTVGGVQVVPMMQGVPSRQASTAQRPHTREGPYAGGPTGLGGQEVVDDPEQAYQSSRSRVAASDPFTDVSRGPASTSTPATQYSSAPPVQSATTGFHQQNLGANLPPGSDIGSQGNYSEGEYEIDPSGQFRRDSRGRKIPYGQGPVSDDGSDDYDASVERARELAHLQQYGHAPPTATATSSAAYEQPGQVVDYSGQGYGSGPGWEAIPRHHHPTRLSDVLEEDERSRTSASQISRRD